MGLIYGDPCPHQSNYSSACTCPKWPLQAPSLLELPEGTSPLSCRITASLSSNSQKRDICLYNLSDPSASSLFC
uniref:Uncharacterized protein n=1 Tax=Bos indicus x Bos taurus TaxID=30522 RepID=A0A4W2D5S7_BOBOX